MYIYIKLCIRFEIELNIVQKPYNGHAMRLHRETAYNPCFLSIPEDARKGIFLHLRSTYVTSH